MGILPCIWNTAICINDKHGWIGLESARKRKEKLFSDLPGKYKRAVRLIPELSAICLKNKHGWKGPGKSKKAEKQLFSDLPSKYG